MMILKITIMMVMVVIMMEFEKKIINTIYLTNK